MAHGVENKAYMRAMQETRRSNAAQPQTSKPRKGARTDRKNNAIKESRNG